LPQTENPVNACHGANDHDLHFVETGYYQGQAGPSERRADGDFSVGAAPKIVGSDGAIVSDLAHFPGHQVSGQVHLNLLAPIMPPERLFLRLDFRWMQPHGDE
jgi:hypothetical protein